MKTLAVAMSATALSLSAAEVTGKVSLKGTPPSETVISGVKTDTNCGKVAQGEAKTRRFVVGPDGGLADTVVYVKTGLEEDLPGADGQRWKLIKPGACTSRMSLRRRPGRRSRSRIPTRSCTM
ncbi:MAG: hypothetical protein KIT22_00290 [Verrucomicrobiae bacterium]|nr:hypothetical protein [Verrucomicrobiae bacterium]